MKTLMTHLYPLALLSSAPVWAGTDAYVGGSVGLFSGGSTVESQDDARFDMQKYGYQLRPGARSALGNLFLGVGFMGNSWLYAGLEANAQIQSAKIRYFLYETAADQQDFEIKIQNSFGLHGRVGLFLMPRVLMYVKAGGSWGRFKATSVQNVLGSGPVSKSKTGAGFSGGVGLEAFWGGQKSDDMKEEGPKKEFAHWTVGLEYMYSNYGSLNLTNVEAGNFKATVRSDAFMVRLRRTF